MSGFDKSKLYCVRQLAGGTIQAQCPVCKENGRDKTGNHLRIYPDGRFNCIVGSKDDEGHNKRIFQLLRDPEAPLVEFIDIEPTRSTSVEKIYPESSLTKLMPDYSYWINRKIKPEILKTLENGIAPLEEKSKLSGRSIFPIRDIDSNQIVGFTGRLTENLSFAPKWKHLFKSSRSVYPWHINGSVIQSTNRVILVESMGDLLSLMTHDINEVLCIFGLNLNNRILSTLIAYDIKHIIISLNRDNDPNKGEGAAQKIKDKLSNFYPIERIIIRMPPEGYKDWGDVCENNDTAAFQQFKEELNKL